MTFKIEICFTNIPCRLPFLLAPRVKMPQIITVVMNIITKIASNAATIMISIKRVYSYYLHTCIPRSLNFNNIMTLLILDIHVSFTS